jgi:outer membrane protein assembly factor BamA
MGRKHEHAARVGRAHRHRCDQPTEVFEFADQSYISGVGFTLTRSTFDNTFRPSKGTRVVLSAEQVGLLGGDYNFSKVGADYTTYFKIREDALGRKTILSLNLSTNYIPQDREDVPVYERYYLGGRSFRGFDFRTVSPKGIRNDNGEPSDDPVGGLWSFFAGAEVKQPVFGDMISVVGFVDTGTVLIEPASTTTASPSASASASTSPSSHPSTSPSTSASRSSSRTTTRNASSHSPSICRSERGHNNHSL